MSFGRPCPVTDLFGVEGRELLGRLEIPEPWRGNIDASVQPIDCLEAQIAEINAELRAEGANHPYVPKLLTVPGIGWVLAFTIAAEIGEIERFETANKLSTRFATPPTPSATSETGAGSASSAAPRSPRSTSPGG